MKPSSEALYTPESISKRVAELARSVSDDAEAGELVLVVVLKGAFPFAADFMREASVPVVLDFIRARSYSGGESSGRVEFLLEPTLDLRGRHVIVLEDILDTGITAKAIFERIAESGPATLKLCTLLNKAGRREVEIEADYVGFEIDNRFVVGYGMDYEENFRDLPGIHVLEED